MHFSCSLRILACFAVLPVVAISQEPEPRAQGQVSPRSNIREFLGLGPAPDAAAAKLGETLYKDNCSACHGQTARGAQGPNLVRSPLVLHDTKGEEIGVIIKKGRPQGGMPPFPALSEVDIYDIAEYIHLQIELTANRGTYRQTYSSSRNQVTGDSEKGKEFFTAHCSSCHNTTGDLAQVGKKYSQPSVMITRIVWPASSAPQQATVITPQGDRIAGTLLDYNDFDVALRTTDGQYYSWPRVNVKVDIPDKLAGHRALLPKYTDDDIHNLTAYLVTLK